MEGGWGGGWPGIRLSSPKGHYSRKQLVCSSVKLLSLAELMFRPPLGRCSCHAKAQPAVIDACWRLGPRCEHGGWRELAPAVVRW